MLSTRLIATVRGVRISKSLVQAVSLAGPSRRLQSTSPSISSAIPSLTVAQGEALAAEETGKDAMPDISSSSLTPFSLNSSPASLTATPAPQPIDAWINVGVEPSVAARLVQSYPEAVSPTPAQRALFLALSRGVDVYLKDYMGRGKTFAVAAAALTLAKRGNRVIVLFPTPHLVNQMDDLLTRMSDGEQHAVVRSARVDDPQKTEPKWSRHIIVATPQSLLTTRGSFHKLTSPTRAPITHLFLDEPDVMLGPLPPKFYPHANLPRHPINRHPPPVISVLNAILGLHQDPSGQIDFSNRNNVSTIWTGATISSNTSRFIRGRGWIRLKSGLVDINYTYTASDRQKLLREQLEQIDQVASGPTASSVLPPHSTPVEPDHYAFLVHPVSGAITPLTNAWDGEPGDFDSPPKDDESLSSPSNRAKLSPFLVEAVAMIHAKSPPPKGMFSLVLPPEHTPLRELSKELEALGVATMPLVPEIVPDLLSGAAADSSGGDIRRHPGLTEETTPISGTTGGKDDADRTVKPQTAAPVFIANRSSVPGLHLPGLHTIYLLSGLDITGLTPAKRIVGGEKARMTFYSVVTGRLGRMGTAASVPDTGAIDQKAQRVISVVLSEGVEELGLRQLFGGTLGSKVDNGPQTRNQRWNLSEWTEGDL